MIPETPAQAAIPAQPTGAEPRTERIPRAAGGHIILTVEGDTGWRCGASCGSHAESGNITGLRVQALVHAQACGRGLDALTILSLTATMCRMSLRSHRVDEHTEFEVTCPREACAPMRSRVAVDLAVTVMAHAALHDGNPPEELLAEIDRWCHVVVGDVDDADFAVFTRDQAAEQIAGLREQLRAAEAAQIVHADLGYDTVELPPTEATRRLAKLARDSHELETDRDKETARAADLAEQLEQLRAATAVADLTSRIGVVRTELARADNKSMTVLSGGSWLLGAGIAVAGLAGIDLPLAATVAGWTAAGVGVTALALLLGTISPRLRGGTALMHYAETVPADLAAAAEARAADPALARDEASAELHEMAGLALAKYRRLRVAVRCTYLAGLSGVVAVIATGITALVTAIGA